MGGIRGRCGKKREADDTETHPRHVCIDTTKRIIGRKERQSIITTIDSIRVLYKSDGERGNHLQEEDS